ncbi:FMN-binding negative transcriptional regulator [Altererythrobacter sp. Root672]|uniref:FMN-binding negative transcriptional regulator n=1 Tax=Altererythrobacter sp. Root672 TaxID=1736584 RepID=UPI0006FBEF87|nr:FMN-binding negative transcriptional regulator [Altererythrobacter sp. Root672]KRA83407.1 transcriptional regulator [Altererythrobacter sp. Root672]
MYLPKIHEETRPDVLHALIRAHPLGTWVEAGADELVVNHLPFVLDTGSGEFGTLRGHVARANPVWKGVAGTPPGVVTFRGPQTYITPSWYPSKREHGKAVPTWNYTVVTVHGRPRFIEEREWLYEHLGQLTELQETGQDVPWALEDAPADFIDKMVGAIVGVEIPISRIEGKWKTSQNRAEADKLGVVAGLLGKGDDESAAMANLVRQHIAG